MRKVLILTLLLILLCGCADIETADTTTATETTAIAESTTATTQMPETIEITSLEQLEKMGNYAVMTDTQKELFVKYADCVREHQVMAENLLFQNSFRLGGRMMLEVMRGGVGDE